jgi:hypothetical protein
MISKQTSLFIGALFASFISFSQGAQAFDVAKQLNPAMAGLEYKINANLFATGSFNSYSKVSNLIGNYSAYNARHRIGFGITSTSNTYSWDNYYFSNRSLTKLSLNKQFSLRDKLILSTGFGAGLESRQITYIDPYDSQSFSDNNKSLQLETGVALKGERLLLGLSGGYQFSLDNKYPFSNQILLNLSAAYTFGKADGLQFTPQVLVSNIGINLGGTVKYKSKYILGGGMVKNGHGPYYLSPYITAGYTFKNKFSINYTYNFLRNTDLPAMQHGLTLSLKLGKK